MWTIVSVQLVLYILLYILLEALKDSKNVHSTVNSSTFQEQGRLFMQLEQTVHTGHYKLQTI